MDEKEKLKTLFETFENQMSKIGISKKEFSKRMNLSNSTFYKWKNTIYTGNRTINMRQYYKALHLLGLKDAITVNQKTRKNREDIK